jgi:hypothetical protein
MDASATYSIFGFTVDFGASSIPLGAPGLDFETGDPRTLWNFFTLSETYMPDHCVG